MDEQYDSRQPDKGRVWLDIESAKLSGANRVQPDAQWHWPTHSHEFWEFAYFVRGSGNVVLPSGAMRPHQYHLVIYPPGLLHKASINPLDPEEVIYVWTEVSGRVSPDTPLLLPDSNGKIRWLCEQMLAEYQSIGVTSLAEAYLKAFLLLIERIWETGVPVECDAVDVAVQYINCSYAEDIDLELLSEICHVSEDYLTHRFTAKLGISPIRYLQSVRMDAAKRLLTTTTIPINEIAERTGFSDPQYFSKMFKRIAGHSPTDFRSSAR